MRRAAHPSRAPHTLQAACAAHLAMLQARARRFLRGREADALDFTQQTMERFLEAFPDGPPPEPRCGRWLSRTLDNLLISEWRKASVRQRALVDPSLQCGREIEIDAFSSRTPLEVAMDELSEETFLAAVGALGPRMRDAYELHLRGLSNAAIAARLGLRANVVHKRLHDARKRLRWLLSRRGTGSIRPPRWATRVATTPGPRPSQVLGFPEAA